MIFVLYMLLIGSESFVITKTESVEISTLAHTPQERDRVDVTTVSLLFKIYEMRTERETKLVLFIIRSCFPNELKSYLFLPRRRFRAVIIIIGSEDITIVPLKCQFHAKTFTLIFREKDFFSRTALMVWWVTE